MRHSELPQLPSLSYICITTTLNNTILNVTDLNGNTLLWASAGSVGFKGSKRSTSYAAQATAEKIAQNCLARNLVRVHVKLKGIGYGKEAAIRGLQTSGLKITKIEDLTRIPFNGCRAKKISPFVIHEAQITCCPKTYKLELVCHSFFLNEHFFELWLSSKKKRVYG